MSRPQLGLAAGAALVLAVAVGVVTFRTGDDGSTGVVDVGEPSAPGSPAAATETLDEQIQRVARIVRDVREMPSPATPTVTVLGPGDLTARVAEDLVLYTEEDADTDLRILAALRAVPRDYALRDQLVTSLSRQVAGFYDPDTGELVVGATDPEERVGRLEELTLAHELQHAFADEVHGLPALDDETVGEDALLARRALVEGDATASMQAYAAVALSMVDQLLLAQEAVALQEQLAGVTELPHVLQRSLTFPYEEGLAFVQTLREDGGWRAIDEAYAAPPTTTAQVLFPERYLAGEEAVAVTPPAAPGDGWVATTTTDLGAADLLLLFEAPGDDPAVALPDPPGSARAWRGGRLDLWVDGADSAVALTIATDQPDRLCADLRAWLVASRPTAEVTQDAQVVRLVEPDEMATLRCGDTTRVGIAPTVATADALASPG